MVSECERFCLLGSSILGSMIRSPVFRCDVASPNSPTFTVRRSRRFRALAALVGNNTIVIVSNSNLIIGVIKYPNTAVESCPISCTCSAERDLTPPMVAVVVACSSSLDVTAAAVRLPVEDVCIPLSGCELT